MAATHLPETVPSGNVLIYITLFPTFVKMFRNIQFEVVQLRKWKRFFPRLRDAVVLFRIVEEIG